LKKPLILENKHDLGKSVDDLMAFYNPDKYSHSGARVQLSKNITSAANKTVNVTLTSNSSANVTANATANATGNATANATLPYGQTDYGVAAGVEQSKKNME